MFPKKLSDYLAKVVKFSCENRWIFLQVTKFSRKIFKFSCNDHQLFLELLTQGVRSEEQRCKRLGGKGPK